MPRRALQIWGIFFAAVAGLSCQGDAPLSPTARPRPVGAATATPRPTPGPAPTATPAGPTAAPTAAATATPAPGGSGQTAVRFAALTVLSVRTDDGSFRNGPYDDGQGTQVINLGEVATFDLTPKNASNQPCETQGEPTWTVKDNLDPSNREYLTELSSSNPFLFRMRASGRTAKTAKVYVYAEVDGVRSNYLYLIVK